MNKGPLQGQAARNDSRADRLELPGVKVLPPFARKRLQSWVLDVLRRDGAAPDYDAPIGDPGLFGPDTVTWKIHADFPSMMTGGLASLMLQSLHPLALAGVWDYSDFRADMLGRLRNTIAFVSRTTYAPRAPAERAIEHIRAIHRPVKGVAADGRPYSAEDPHLLTWVHCAEAWSFLCGYRAYCYRHVPRVLQDRYLEEMAFIAGELGARAVPKSRTALQAFFRDVRPELVYDDRTHEVLEVLRSIRLPIPFPNFGRGLFFGAATALLPDWALDLMDRAPLERRRDRAAMGAMKLIAPSIRDALSVGGLAWRACARTGADYESLFRWPQRED
ncbi:MAG: oxygenase MpaB family protein [Gammaproteobacteria bacterium]|nr:oxygenase MpaB family protein [Gammaproteobacteria bacterium]